MIGYCSKLHAPTKDKSLKSDSFQLVAVNRREDSFSALLVAIIPTLRAFAGSLSRRPDLVDDLVQEALVKAWAARFSFEPGSNFKAWMFTIVRHHYYTMHRKQQCFMPWDPEAAERLLVCEPSQIALLELTELVSGLQTLPACQRDALILVGLDGCCYEEVAQILGCAVGTAKSRVARGRIALRKYLESQGASCGARRMTSSQASAVIFEWLRLLDRPDYKIGCLELQPNRRPFSVSFNRTIPTHRHSNSRASGPASLLCAVGQA